MIQRFNYFLGENFHFKNLHLSCMQCTTFQYYPRVSSLSKCSLLFFLLCDCYGEFCTGVFNSLPDDKILVWSKLKQIADDILECI